MRAGASWQRRWCSRRFRAARVNFVQDGTLHCGCPSKRVACQVRAYPAPGEVLLNGPSQGVCTRAGFLGPWGGRR
jgi:hypothetical protein